LEAKESVFDDTTAVIDDDPVTRAIDATSGDSETTETTGILLALIISVVDETEVELLTEFDEEEGPIAEHL
jgi:hypothetical protein